MMLSKVIIAPDSFKGVLTSKQVADIIADEVNTAFPDCAIVKMPIADGGEGSVDTIISAIGGETYTAKVISPDDRLIDAYYGIASNGTAIIEMAQSSGITKQISLNPMTSTTYGFGQLILDALDRGAREFILCIGGSATNDGGCGMAAALGVSFFDINGNSFIPSGETLHKIVRIDIKNTDKRIKQSKFTVMCDVDNPLYGERGAAYIFGPQKGATPEQVVIIDEGLRHYNAMLVELLGKNFSDTPGAGAAGGLGAGCMAFLDASLKSGIETILKLNDFKEHLSGTDLIITGEGKLDSQSFSGKVISGILFEAQGVPVWSICGVCDCEESMILSHNLSVFQVSEGITIAESMSNPDKYLRLTTRKALVPYQL